MTEATARVSIRLCGGFQIRSDTGSLGPRQAGGAKPRHVLIMLALSLGAPVAKTRLVENLWAIAPSAAALGTLESYVSLLRGRLRSMWPTSSPMILTVPGGYCLDPRVVSVDVVTFREQFAAAMAPGVAASESLDRFMSGLALVESPLLPGEGDAAWLEAERELHVVAVQRALAAAMRTALDVGKPELAETWARRALAADPFAESAWATLLTSLEARGRPVDALREYHTCRRLFSEELGCAPGPALRWMFSRLLRDTTDDQGRDSRDLVDAVLRLHSTTQLGVPSPGLSLQRDWMLVDDLLRQVSELHFAPRALQA